MTLEQKIDRACAVISEVLTEATVLYWSSGKDSMVLLHLAWLMGLDLPVVFHRHPVFPEKEEFANRIIREWGLRVHSYPPQATRLSLEPHPEIINYYTLKGGKTLLEPVGLDPLEEGRPFACGFELLNTLLGVVRYPWDVMLIGQKNCDQHFLFEDMRPSHAVIEMTPGLKQVYPLIDFTDEDIWEYTERFSVPYNEKRYDRANGYREFPGATANTDHYPTCVRCIVPSVEADVECPKTGRVIPNVYNPATVVQIKPLPYMKSFEWVING
jgi:3'-phosphoadenosine 5'-phosphosulfate sulfotransferase (PAPS reductase)/FAD synthetase